MIFEQIRHGGCLVFDRVRGDAPRAGGRPELDDADRYLALAAESGLTIRRIVDTHIETFAAEPVKYQYHASTTDRRLVADPAAPPIARERRTGYDWYGDWPAKLLSTEVPAWRARMARSTTRN